MKHRWAALAVLSIFLLTGCATTSIQTQILDDESLTDTCIELQNIYNIANFVPQEYGNVISYTGFDAQDRLIAYCGEGQNSMVAVGVDVGEQIAEQVYRFHTDDLQLTVLSQEGDALIYVLKSAGAYNFYGLDLGKRGAEAPDFLGTIEADSLILNKAPVQQDKIYCVEQSKGSVSLYILDTVTQQVEQITIKKSLLSDYAEDIEVEGIHVDQARIAALIHVEGEHYIWTASLEEADTFGESMVFASARVVPQCVGDAVYYINEDNCLMRLDVGDKVEMLIAQNTKAFTVSADGQTVVFLSVNETAMRLYATTLDSAEHTLVLIRQRVEKFRLSPDGRLLAITYREKGHTDAVAVIALRVK